MLPLPQSDTSIKGFTLCRRCDRQTQVLSVSASQSVFQVSSSSSLPVLGSSSHWHHAHSWHRAA